jgi:folate-binding protein YgfZ
MASPKMVLLRDRGVIRVTGADARKLLQGLITNDMAKLDRQPAIHAGLLTPQGKILFDFFVVRAPDGYLLDVGKADELIRRLTLYKLRAAVVLEDFSPTHRVAASWDGPPPEIAGAVVFPDPRLAALGHRIIACEDTAPLAANATDSQYHAHRIALGVPEGGKDYAFGDTFPHEALFDRLDGVDFDKGCFVGQEVVSRMEHRAIVRKRVVPVHGAGPLPEPGTPIKAGEAVIGTLGSAAGPVGLALLRLDRAAEARSKGQSLLVGHVPLTIEGPELAAPEEPT